MNLDDENCEVLAAVIKWAYANEISVLFGEQRDYDGHCYPTVRFKRGNKNVEMALWPLIHIYPRLEAEWEKIGLALCVEPLVLPDRKRS